MNLEMLIAPYYVLTLILYITEEKKNSYIYKLGCSKQ